GRDEDVELGELWQIHADGIRQANAALFDEHHRRDGGERLRHRVETKDRVLRHRGARLRVELPDRLEIRDLSPSSDDRDRAGEALRLDFARKGGRDTPETLAWRTSVGISRCAGLVRETAVEGRGMPS